MIRIAQHTDAIRNLSADDRRRTAQEELEDVRIRGDRLREEVGGLRRLLERSRRHIGVTAAQLRQTLGTCLRLAGVPGGIQALSASRERTGTYRSMNAPAARAGRAGSIHKPRARYEPSRGTDRPPLPVLYEEDARADDRTTGAGAEPQPQPEHDAPRLFEFPAHDVLMRDPGWTAALDALRERRRRGESLGAWRRRAAVKPIVFEDTARLGEKAVHLHLEHRVARRLLGRFTAQGLIHHDLSKACLAATPGRETRVVLLGRLAVYGQRAARLHEEMIPITARWIDPARRTRALTPYGQAGEQTTLASLQSALDGAGANASPMPCKRVLAHRRRMTSGI